METVSTTAGTAEVREYAGFWLRFVAYIIDYVILQLLSSFIIIPILGALGFGFFAATEGMQAGDIGEEEALAMMVTLFSTLSSAALLTFILQILYFAILQSGSRQATLGKMALGLKVTDMNGEKIDFGKAVIRELSKLISYAILLIGYIMAGFTEKKQALHDIIPGTLVVKAK